MAGRARRCGLAFTPDQFQTTAGVVDPELRKLGQQIAPDALAAMHNSRKGAYRLLRASPRRLVDPEGLAPSVVASSAVLRRKGAGDYAPPNLVAYLDEDRPVAEV
jgi:hypothetical protein